MGGGVREGINYRPSKKFEAGSASAKSSPHTAPMVNRNTIPTTQEDNHRIPHSMSTAILLPGEAVPSDSLPKSKKGTLTLGPGLRHIPPTNITATTLGSVAVDNKKSAVWLESTNGRYQPSTGDLVIAQVHHGSTDTYHCALTPQTPYALLGQLAFEGASKKSRPQLSPGDLVYGCVSRAVKGEDVEIEGFNSATGKSEGMGQLKGGMVFEVSPAFARRLMMGKKGGVKILEGVGEKIRFEVAVGRNGRVWVDSGNVRTTASIGKLLTDSDEKAWSEEDQEKALKKALKDMS
jgi:exosome complex component RRP40